MSDFIKRDAPIILAELDALLKHIDQNDANALADAILSCRRVFAAGAGRSGLLLRCAAMRLMHMDKPVYVVGEIVTPAIGEGDLLLIASGSGETGSLVNMAKKAVSVGAEVALVTANPASTIAGLARVTVRLPAPTPKAAIADFIPSQQPMGNLFEQGTFLFLDALVMELMQRTGKTSEVMFRRHANLE